MTTQYTDYQVEIRNIPFHSLDGDEFPKTALVTLYNKKKEAILTKEFGFMETAQIYDKIEADGGINLSHCYVKDFSMDVYRKYKLIEKKETVAFTFFSAREAFFESKHEVNFSHSRFPDELVSFEGSHFAKGKVIFSHSHFGNKNTLFTETYFREGHMDFSNCMFGKGDVSFKNIIARNGLKNFQYVKFGEGKKNFVNFEFGGGEISFINTDFDKGDVDFKVARFGEGKKNFRFAKFKEGDVSFDRADFGDGEVDFRTVEFHSGRVTFSRAIFGKGEVSFEGMEVEKGRVNFKKAQFGEGNINFELAECGNAKFFFDRTEFNKGSISFFKSKFQSLSLKSCHIDYYLDLRVEYCNYIDLSDTISRDIIDLNPHGLKMDIQRVNFAGMRLIGRIYIDWFGNGVKDLIKKQGDTDNRSKAEQYRILKENFNVTGQYNDEDKAYVEFKRHESRMLLEEALEEGKINAVWAYPTYWFKQIVFDKAGLYATSPLRVLSTMLISYVLFSLLFALLILTNHADIVSSIGDPDQLSGITRSFYHSAITFLTIGYGDYYPSGIMRWLSSIEGFVGLFLMSYFTVAFVRKVLR